MATGSIDINACLPIIYNALPVDGSPTTYSEIKKLIPYYGEHTIREGLRVLNRYRLVSEKVEGANHLKKFARINRFNCSLDDLISDTVKLVENSKVNAFSPIPTSPGWGNIGPVTPEKQKSATGALSLLKAFKEGAALT